MHLNPGYAEQAVFCCPIYEPARHWTIFKVLAHLLFRPRKNRIPASKIAPTSFRTSFTPSSCKT